MKPSEHLAPSRGGVVLISLVIVYVTVLVLAPIGGLVQGALGKGVIGIWDALTDARFLRSFWLSVQIGILIVILQALLGTAVAWALARHEFRGKGILNALIDIPFAISPVVVGYMLLLAFGRNSFLGPYLAQAGVRVAFALPGMVLATWFVTLPFMIREMVPVIKGLDRQQELAAATLGASSWAIFWRITFPSLKTGLIYGMSLTLARALGEFGAVLVIGGGIQGRTETATLYIFRAFEERQYVDAYVAALVLGLCSVLLIALADRQHKG